MRNFAIALAATAAIATVSPAPVAAMTAVDSAGIRSAVEAANPVEKVACWRYGWRGFGLYPGWCGLIAAAPAYVVPPAYAPPVYDPTPAYNPSGRCWIDGRWRGC
jgi:hypothetical protein